MTEFKGETLYLIYDGECLLCQHSAHAIRIQKAVGRLETINARTAHPLVMEALQQGYDLNAGILVKFRDQTYYGADAVHFLALIGSPSDHFNKLNKIIFKTERRARFFYPLFKGIRNLLLVIRRTPPLPLPAQQPLIQKVFGNSYTVMPPILQMRYQNRPYSTDSLVLQGEMNIHYTWFFRLLSPLFRFTGALVPYEALNIPVRVEIRSRQDSPKMEMHRTFHYPNKGDYHFRSDVLHIKENIVIELMRWRIASKLIFRYKGNQIAQGYGGYVFRLGKWLIPLPLAWLIGRFSAVEVVVDGNQFAMQVRLEHRLLGKIFQYDGCFKIESHHD